MTLGETGFWPKTLAEDLSWSRAPAGLLLGEDSSQERGNNAGNDDDDDDDDDDDRDDERRPGGGDVASSQGYQTYAVFDVCAASWCNG